MGLFMTCVQAFRLLVLPLGHLVSSIDLLSRMDKHVILLKLYMDSSACLIHEYKYILYNINVFVR